MAKCKRCGIKTALSEEDINKMVDEVIHMKGIRLVDEDIYNERIAACMQCEKLEYGSTCMLCGWVVQVRAMLRDGKCPYPKNKKW